VDGTLRIFFAEALLLPTGLVTTAFVTRTLGPAAFGVLTLALTLVTWLEWTSSAVLSRTTVKLVSGSDGWQRVGSTVVWLAAVTGVVTGTLLWALAGPIAHVLREPPVAALLRVLAVDVPLFTLAQAHRNILVGLGEFHQRALVSAWRWIVRMVLTVALVATGWSLMGVVLGSIGATAVELAVARFYVHPPLRVPRPFPLRQLGGYAAPLFLTAIALRLLDKTDLFMLTALGASAVTVGEYGAAQALSVVPALLSLALSGPLLSTLSRLRHAGNESDARTLATRAVRVIVLLAPYAALAAGSADGIVRLVFGERFRGAGPLFALLCIAALALLILSVFSSLIIAIGRPALVLAITAPLVPVGLAGDLLLIPRAGAPGAAAVTLGVGVLGAAAAGVVTARLWAVWCPGPSAVRAGVISLLVWGGARLWHADGALVVVQIAALGLAIPLVYVLLGEVSRTTAVSLARAGRARVAAWGGTAA